MIFSKIIKKKMKQYRIVIIYPGMQPITETINANLISSIGEMYVFEFEDGKRNYYPISRTIIKEQ